jgi:hypothetical protein
MNLEISRPWTAYRTRFLVHARQLTDPLIFTDALGREHSGKPGDYLVESSDGLRRITPRHLFEDIYVPLHPIADAIQPQAAATCDQPFEGRRQPASVKQVSASTWTATGSASAKEEVAS